MKDVYYFPHDYHAHNDPKCSALIKDFGMEGYGLYWCLIEIIHESGGKIKKFPKLYNGLAHSLNMDIITFTKQIEALLQDYELLLQDDDFIWSDRAIRNLQERQEKYEARARAGRIGGLSSGKQRRNNTILSTNNEALLKQPEATVEANEPKERKGKEKKEKEIKEKKKEKEETTKNLFAMQNNQESKKTETQNNITCDYCHAVITTPAFIRNIFTDPDQISIIKSSRYKSSEKLCAKCIDELSEMIKKI